MQGVAKAKLIGASKREIAVDLDPARLEALGMGVDEVIGGLSAENVNTPLGRLTLGLTEVPLRISGKPKSPADYADMVIGRRGTTPIRLGEVGDDPGHHRGAAVAGADQRRTRRRHRHHEADEGQHGVGG